MQPLDERTKTLADAYPDARERAEMERVAHDLPDLHVAVSVGVHDEEYVAESDVVTATVTLTHANLPSPDAPVPPAYAPLFPGVRREEWYVFLTTAAGDKLIAMKTVRPDVAVVEEKLQFLAPDKAGRYMYRLHVRSNAYCGLDQVLDVPFEVKPKSDVRGSGRLGGGRGGRGRVHWLVRAVAVPLSAAERTRRVRTHISPPRPHTFRRSPRGRSTTRTRRSTAPKRWRWSRSWAAAPWTSRTRATTRARAQATARGGA